MRKHHPMLVRRFDTLLIHDTSARSGQILYAAPPRSMHVIREGEEGITRTCGLIQLLPPLLPLFFTQRLRDTFEKTFPARLLGTLEDLAADVEVDGVRLVRALSTFFEREGKDLWMMPEPPQVGFRSGQAGAVDTRLLSGSDSNDRPTVCVRDAVRLRVLEGERGNDQVAHGILWKLEW